ncbi:MAG TPA: hypothetical protein VF676_09225 [Flavobacterium sp.]|jgi:hypothetical protein
MHRVIGGEFDIDLTQSQWGASFFENEAFFSSGRAALYHILRDIQKHEDCADIFLPDYLCESVIEVVKHFAFNIRFYTLNPDLSIDEYNFEEKYIPNSVVLIINFFGCSDTNSQAAWIRSNFAKTCIIEDNVQAFFAMESSSESDYAFTSFRKAFAVPDGAIVKAKAGRIKSGTGRNTFAQYKTAAAVLKNLSLSADVDEHIYLELFRQGEELIDDNLDSAVSPLTKTLLLAANFEQIASKRKANSEVIINGLAEMGIIPVVTPTPPQVPLFIPVRLQNRDAVRTELFKENIFCPVHWPLPKGFELQRGAEMAQNELSIIIDQRYSTEDMTHILNVLKKSGANGI